MIHRVPLIVGARPGRASYVPVDTTLGTISDLSATAGDTQVVLAWTAAANATSHQPQYRASGSGTWLDFGSALGGSATGVTVTGLTNDQAYEFSVVAGDGVTTTRSNTATATPVAGSTNEPAGFTQLWYMDGTSKTGLGSMATDSNVVVVSDAEAPNGSALELRWPLGTASGFSSQYTPTFAFAPREIYMRMVIKWNPNWDFNPGGDKWTYFGHAGMASAYFPQFRSVGGPDHRIGFQVQTPNGGTPNFWWVNQTPSVISSDSTNVEVFTLADGTYHTFEWVMRAQSAAGVADGEFHFWIDGVLETTGTAFSFHNSGSVLFGPPEFYPYWGGSASSKDIDPYDWARYAEFYVSGTE